MQQFELDWYNDLLARDNDTMSEDDIYRLKHLRERIQEEEKIALAERVHYWLRHNQVPAGDMDAWFNMGLQLSRVVRVDTLPSNQIVSTVFLGIDHRFGEEGPPLWFETMIFGGPHDGYQERCSTWEQAEELHAKALELLKSKG